ncbi:MAG: flagellar basal body L-ring protein FlgH [Pseudomonadota bacterium]
MKSGASKVYSLFIAVALSAPLPVASAEDLFKGGTWADLASDNKARTVGDILTVIVFQSAEARNSAEAATSRRSTLDLRAAAGNFDEGAEADFAGAFSGRGEVRRSESLLTQFSVEVVGIFPNGDLEVLGEQLVLINGETSRVGVRGRIRRVDVTPENRVISTQIANAEIAYDGSGFVSRSARPGLISRLFLFLGL